MFRNREFWFSHIRTFHFTSHFWSSVNGLRLSSRLALDVPITKSAPGVAGPLP
jgi:hypothetical protein